MSKTVTKNLLGGPATLMYPKKKRTFTAITRGRVDVNIHKCIFCGLCEEACPTLAIQLTPDFETCQYDILTLVAEKADLLVDHGGKNHDYNFYRHAGVTVLGSKGSHINEAPPVNLKSNLP